jgi:hypothetical protein
MTPSAQIGQRHNQIVSALTRLDAPSRLQVARPAGHAILAARPARAAVRLSRMSGRPGPASWARLGGLRFRGPRPCPGAVRRAAPAARTRRRRGPGGRRGAARLSCPRPARLADVQELLPRLPPASCRAHRARVAAIRARRAAARRAVGQHAARRRARASGPPVSGSPGQLGSARNAARLLAPRSSVPLCRRADLGAGPPPRPPLGAAARRASHAALWCPA